jgi:hypothetical protein
MEINLSELTFTSFNSIELNLLEQTIGFPWLPWNINNPNPQFSKAHLTILNLNNFKMIEVMGLKIIASRFR